MLLFTSQSSFLYKLYQPFRRCVKGIIPSRSGSDQAVCSLPEKNTLPWNAKGGYGIALQKASARLHRHDLFFLVRKEFIDLVDVAVRRLLDVVLQFLGLVL